MIKNKYVLNVIEILKKLTNFKSTNSKYRDPPKDVDAERHPEEQMYPDLFKMKNELRKQGHIPHYS